MRGAGIAGNGVGACREPRWNFTGDRSAVFVDGKGCSVAATAAVDKYSKMEARSPRARAIGSLIDIW